VSRLDHAFQLYNLLFRFASITRCLDFERLNGTQEWLRLAHAAKDIQLGAHDSTAVHIAGDLESMKPKIILFGKFVLDDVSDH